MTGTDTERLLHQATVAAQLGQRERAETLFNQIVALEPENVDAWIGLAGVVDDPAEKRRIYETVLAIDPEHPIAREGLRALRANDDGKTASPSQLTAAPSSDEEAEVSSAESSPSEQWPVLRYEDGVPIYACAYHPKRETTLRCNRCGKPICTDCAVLTDVGYRCPDCVAELTGRFYHAQPKHVITSLLASAILGFLGVMLGTIVAANIGFWTVFVALPLSGIIAEGIWRSGARHRARRLHLYASVVVLLFGLLGFLVGIVIAGGGVLFGLFTLVVTVVTVYQRLR